MLIRFTKMQGAGNDFVVLDETVARLPLSPAHYRYLADRHFGVGADQILSVRPAPAPGVDFEYIIHNADGGEVEQCGNGSRCFARFVRDKGLSDKDAIRVHTRAGIIEPVLNPMAASPSTWARRCSNWPTFPSTPAACRPGPRAPGSSGRWPWTASPRWPRWPPPWSRWATRMP
jgi:diaminopimelate epimerase